ncbi:hypothetical protein MHK_007059 [Candidatus Magnetomorum sp. HK-1]|nr:hypothetical protein MHK_007059 [Candidatus Magnetomorum sp. HK-1]
MKLFLLFLYIYYIAFNIDQSAFAGNFNHIVQQNSKQIEDEFDLADSPTLETDYLLEENSSQEDFISPQKTVYSIRDRLDKLPFEFRCFFDSRMGVRLFNKLIFSKRINLCENRFHNEFSKSWNKFQFNLSSDFYYDVYLKSIFQSNFREVNILYKPVDNIYIKAGRQILSWGVGDLIFINDLFPKDFQSFLIGRDQAYFKAPSDSIKMDIQYSLANFTLIYTPEFNEDIYVKGERISFIDPLGIRRSEDNQLPVDNSSNWFRKDELAWRFFLNYEGHELAVYGYYGYWKSPFGIDLTINKFYFPKLYAHGFSIQEEVLHGIFSIESGYYFSKDDVDGDNSFVQNSDLRFLISFEKELIPDFTANIQFYIQKTLQFNALKNNLLPMQKIPEEITDIITIRLTQLMLKQNLQLSLFTYCSLVEKDGYLRLSLRYNITDDCRLELGANIFFAKDKNTKFGQFYYNKNFFFGFRLSF